MTTQDLLNLHEQAKQALDAVEEEMHKKLENENLTRNEVYALLVALDYE